MNKATIRLDRHEQIALLHHGSKLWQLVFTHAAHAGLGGFKIHHEVDRGKIQDRRNDRRDGYLGVGDAGDLAMMKAPAPMIGGMICPPVEAAASIAPALRAG